MIDSMLDMEPHLSVHQPNVFVFFTSLWVCWFCECVLHGNIFIAQHFCAIFILIMHAPFLSMFGNENNDSFFMVQKRLSPRTVSSVFRLCHCAAFTKPVWECIHVWESLTFIFSSSLHIGFCVCSGFCFVFLADCCVNSLIWNVGQTLDIGWWVKFALLQMVLWYCREEYQV